MERAITWYEVLGVLPGAEPDKIRRKYDERTHLLRTELIAGAPSNVLGAVSRAQNFLDTAWEILGDPASLTTPRVFGLDVVSTTSIAQGTFLVGSGSPVAAEIALTSGLPDSAVQ